MKLGFIQYDVKHNKEENFKCIEKSICKKEYDLLVLPELSLCGYLFEDRNDLRKIAEVVPNGDSVKRMLEISKKHNCGIVFGMAEQEGENIYNTAVLVHRGRYIGKYRKIHLSDLEKKIFDRGEKNEIFEIDGIKIGIQICFDLWFPEISREQIRKGANLLCALANFGGETTCSIARIRAVENLTPLLLCNRIGREVLQGIDAQFLGKSALIDVNGKSIAVGKKGKEAVSCCMLELGNKRSNLICRDFDEEISIHYKNEYGTK